jgi:hypothetical protein
MYVSEKFFGSFGRKVWDNCVEEFKKRLKEGERSE